MTSVGVMASSVASGPPPTYTDVLMENFSSLANWAQSGTITSVAARTGVGPSMAAFANGMLTYTIPVPNQVDTITVGVAFKPAAWGGSETNILELRSDAAATLHNWVSIRNDGTMRFGTNVSGQGGPVAGFTTGVFSYLEAQVKLHDTLGAFTVKINTTTIMSATNVDTKNAGTKTGYDTVRIQCPTGGAALVFDDCYITMGAGAPFKGAITIS